MKRTSAVLFVTVATLVLQHFSTLSNKPHDFRKKLLNIKCFLCFLFFLGGGGVSLKVWSENFQILRNDRQDSIINVHMSSCEVSVILVIFEWNLNFLERFTEKDSTSKLHGNPSKQSRVFPHGRTDGQTATQNVTKPICNIMQSCDAPCFSGLKCDVCGQTDR
jgi:hypothetical protein